MHARKYVVSVLGGLFCVLAGVPAQADPQDPAERSAGYYVLQVGSAKVVALSDGILPTDLEVSLKGTTQADVRSRLRNAFLPTPTPLSSNAYLIETGGKRVLIDTGAGGLMDDKVGMLRRSLAAAGYRPDDITDIVITHLHVDHAGRLVRDKVAGYPNAVVHLASAEADYWLSAKERADAPEEQKADFDAAPKLLAPYRAAGRLKLYQSRDTIAPGISYIPKPGHTPGSIAVELNTDHQVMLFMGNLVVAEAVQFAEPSVTFVYDQNGNETVSSRRAALDEAAEKGLLLAFAHASFPGIGHVLRHNKGYEWVPGAHSVDASKGEH